MIVGRQQMDEDAVTSAATPAEAVSPGKRRYRLSRQIVVRCLPDVEFAVPIFFEFESPSRRVTGTAPAEVGEVLAAV
jgi:hypothetical protein